ncbi:MAG: hypothetical protein ACP5GZ_01450 [Vulcanisaeta sp.]|uniref:hypothetical protein n=1 Tax=Vulcanisaeta sp. TaxID=2020871 RepID=UPI003D0B2588
MRGRNIHGLVELGLRLIEDAKCGKISIDESIDGLWEVLINLEYEAETENRTKTMLN